MKRNKLLLLSLYFFRFIQVMLVLTGIGITCLLGYYLFDPASFAKIKFILQEDLVVYADGMRLTHEDSRETNAIYLKDVQPVVLYFMYFKIIATLTLVGFIIQEFVKVVKSLQQLQTFRHRNVEAFRKMAWFFIALFILNCISFIAVGHQINFQLNLELRFIILTITAFILSEIFKEGNRLYEEEQLTV